MGSVPHRLFPRIPVLFLVLVNTIAFAQHATLRPSEPVVLPGTSDSNSPVHWQDGRIAIFQSMSLPLISEGAAQSAPLKVRPVLLNSFTHYPLWIEATWVDDDGTLYAWYHHEMWVCKNGLSVPEIGALVSKDGGHSFSDLGIILDSGDSTDCNAGNGIFAGGHGDFTVLLDPWRLYFYFYFGNYGGPSQGIAAARLPFSARTRPVGQVSKYYQHSWTEPGLGGRVTAILPARVPWNRVDTDSFWGPSLHWNTYLNQYVMLLNRACCTPGWPSEGIYISFNPDISSPDSWSTPAKILGQEDAQWYPQVIGLRPDGTDKLAGRVARFYMKGESHWRIVFDY
jgi:hypothetical protein